jgi:hypothetical protein
MQGPFPSLGTLTIGADETNSMEGDFLNADECVEILRAAPELGEYDFDNVFYEQDIHSAGSPLQPLTNMGLGIPKVALLKDTTATAPSF